MTAYVYPSDGATRLIMALCAAVLVGLIVEWWWTR